MDIQAQYGPLRAEIDAAIAGVLDSGRFILGPEGRALEAAVSERLDGRPCAGVANGTDALVIALNALDIGPGDEVITTPYTFYATAEAIARVGATPVFADIDPVTYCLDPEATRARIGARDQGDPPGPHLRPPGRHAGVHGARRASTAWRWSRTARRPSARAPRRARSRPSATLATFSFFPTKNFPGMGDGGMVVCRDDEPGRPRAPAALPRLEGQGRLRRGGLQLAPRRPPGRDHPRLLPAPGRAGTRPARRPPPGTPRRASARSMTLPGGGRGRHPHLPPLHGPPPRRDGSARRPRRGRASRAPSTTASRCTCSRSSPRLGLLRGRPADRRGVRPHRPRAADAPEPDPRARSRRVVAAAH